jgi:hypothetical protein
MLPSVANGDPVRLAKEGATKALHSMDAHKRFYGCHLKVNQEEWLSSRSL